LGNVTAVDVRAGRYSTVVLDTEGRLWVWGYDGCAAKGVLPQQHEAWRPRLVEGQLQGHKVSTFDVGKLNIAR
jgi:alpha-tubulin suppressor-like RCC1 family protein